MKVLLAVAWTLAALDAIFVVMMTLMAHGSGEDSPGRGMASGLAVTSALILAGMAGLLLFSSRYGSVAAAAVAIVVLLFPLIVAGAPLLEQGINHLKVQREASSRGKFVRPELTAMADAVATNDTHTLAELLRLNSNLDDRDGAGDTLLGYAVESVLEKRQSIEPVRALLDAGANPNQMVPGKRRRILLRVFEANSPISNELFKLLLDKKADPDTRDDFGVPMLHHAKGQLLKLKLLADSRADLNAASGCHYRYGWTPVMALTMDEAYDEALYLVQRGADVHHTAPDGTTLISVLERRKAIAEDSGSSLPASYRALTKAVLVHASRR